MAWYRCNSASGGGGGGIDFSEVDALGTNEALCYAHWDLTNTGLGEKGKRTISDIKSYTYSRFQASANNHTEYVTIIFDPKKCDVLSPDSRYNLRAITNGALISAFGVKDGDIVYMGCSHGANATIVPYYRYPYQYDYIILEGEFNNSSSSSIQLTII